MRNLRPRPGVTLLALAAWLALVAANVSSGAAAQSRLAALPAAVPAPPDNPTTPERVALGRLLFWDPILSGPKDVACATCHHPAFGYADGLDLSIGANGVGAGPARSFGAGHTPRLVKRNSQSILNVAFNGLTTGGDAVAAAAPMFWDLRVRSLEAQALEPLKALEEMRGDAYPEERAVPAAVARLAAIPEYRRLFARAFDERNPVNQLNLARALAAFQRTLVAANAPFDRYVRGDATALSAEQISGMEQFQSAGCVNCHSGPMFSDFATHVLGVPDNAKLTEPDAGISNTLRVSHALAAQPRRHGAVHAQRRVRDAPGRRELLPADQPGRRPPRWWWCGAIEQSQRRPRSDRSAGAPPEHARSRSARPDRVPRRADGPGVRSVDPGPRAERAGRRRTAETLTLK